MPTLVNPNILGPNLVISLVIPQLLEVSLNLLHLQTMLLQEVSHPMTLLQLLRVSLPEIHLHPGIKDSLTEIKDFLQEDRPLQEAKDSNQEVKTFLETKDFLHEIRDFLQEVNHHLEKKVSQ